jgi:hypothetical protein
MHKEEYFAGKALKKDFTPNRKYSSIFGWENWMRCYKQIALGKLWLQKN